MVLKKIWKSNFYEYFRYFVLLSLAIITLISGVQYYFSYNSLRDTAIDSNKNTLILLKGAHEAVMAQIESSMDGVFSNPSFQKYMTYYQQGKYTMLVNLQNQLDSIVGSNEYIKSVCLYYPKYDFTLSSDLSVATLAYYHDSDFLLGLNDTHFDYSMTVSRMVNYAFADRGERVLTLVRTLPVYYNSQTPDAYVVIDIDLSYFDKAFRNISTRRNAYILVADANGNILTGAGNPQSYGEEYLALPVTEAVSAQTRTVDGEKMLVVHTMSESSGWIYIYAEPMSDITGGLDRLGNIFLIACAGALLISLMGSLLFSYRIFKPIRSIYDKIALAFGTDGDAGCRETDRIISHIDEVITRNDQLQNRQPADPLSESERQFIRLMQGRCDGPRRHDDPGHCLRLPADPHHFMLMVADSVCEDGQDLLNELAAALGSAAAGVRPLMAASPAAGETAVLLGFYSRDPAPDVKAVAGALRDFLYGGAACSVGVSAPFDGTRGLSIAYRQAREALDMRIVRGRRAIVLFGELQKSLYLPYPVTIENNIFIALRKNHWQAVETALSSFEDYLVSNDADANTVRSFYLQLYSVSQKLVNDISGTQRKQGSLCNLDLLSMASIGDMNDLLLSVYREALKNISTRQGVLSSRLINDVCEYINENLGEDLSIKQLGEHFEVSATALRKDFKDETKMTVKHYIDMQRIARAKKLLAESDMMIQDMAVQLGFWHPQSFIAFFKSAVGMTPGEYKMLNQQQQEPRNP